MLEEAAVACDQKQPQSPGCTLIALVRQVSGTPMCCTFAFPCWKSL